MNNAGGILRLWWVDALNYEGLSDDELPVLRLTAGAKLHNIAFAEDGGSLAIQETEDDNGPMYSVSITLKIPKISQANQDSLIDVKWALRTSRVVLVVEDANEQSSVLGAPGAWWRITPSSDTGTVAADLNHTKLQISADLDQDQIFIADPFLDEGSDS
jgi:hypothetical protein